MVINHRRNFTTNHTSPLFNIKAIVRDRLCWFMVNIIFIISLLGCTIDLPGLFGSGDLGERWKERNNFKYLDTQDPISLDDNVGYSFIVLSDTHILDKNAFGFENFKDEIGSEDKFVVVLGDITQYGQRQDIEKFIEIAGTLGVPCYPVIGNHDVYQGNWPEWKEAIGSTCYRINGGGATLFILDSANAYFGNKQLDWLEKEIKTATGRVFTFSHSNLFVNSPLELQQFTDVRERARFLSILKGRCDAMFWSHSHKRNVDKIGGIRYINIEDYKSTGIYCRVSVTNEGISWEFLKN